MELPIIVDCSGDVTIYRTVEQAINSIEACDVSDDYYKVYDRVGRRVYIEVVKGSVQITEGEDTIAHDEPLRSILIHRLLSANVTIESIEQASLEDLVYKSLEVDESYGYSDSIGELWHKLTGWIIHKH